MVLRTWAEGNHDPHPRPPKKYREGGAQEDADAKTRKTLPKIHDCVCLVREAKANLTHRLRTFGSWSALRG